MAGNNNRGGDRKSKLSDEQKRYIFENGEQKTSKEWAEHFNVSVEVMRFFKFKNNVKMKVAWREKPKLFVDDSYLLFDVNKFENWVA